MASMTTQTCKWKRCSKLFQARTADVKRGWGLFCSKTCKAKHQECNTGQYRKLQDMAVTSEYAAVLVDKSLSKSERQQAIREIEMEEDHMAAMDDCESGWDAHKDYSF